MDSELAKLRAALRRLPTADLRPGFADRALRNAVLANSAAPSLQPNWARRLATSWQTWIGAALGATVAATVSLIVLRPVDHSSGPASDISLALHEARDVDVLVDSERDLEGAMIRVAVTGAVALNGFDNEHTLEWHTDLRRGANLLSLPLIARSTGQAQLLAVIEHEGKTRQVIINFTVRGPEVSKS